MFDLNFILIKPIFYDYVYGNVIFDEKRRIIEDKL
jgi:hypothetical protein